LYARVNDSKTQAVANKKRKDVGRLWCFDHMAVFQRLKNADEWARKFSEICPLSSMRCAQICLSVPGLLGANRKPACLSAAVKAFRGSVDNAASHAHRAGDTIIEE
jgi:hypothetical protein